MGTYNDKITFDYVDYNTLISYGEIDFLTTNKTVDLSLTANYPGYYVGGQNRMYGRCSANQSIDCMTPTHYKVRNSTLYTNLVYCLFRLSQGPYIDVTVSEYDNSNIVYYKNQTTDSSGGNVDKGMLVRFRPDVDVTPVSTATGNNSMSELYTYFQVSLYHLYFQASGVYRFQLSYALAGFGTAYCKSGNKVNVYGTTSTVTADNMVGCAVGVGRLNYSSPEILSCTDAGNYNRTIKIKNNNKVPVSLYVAPSKVKSTSAGNWYPLDQYELAADATATITIYDVSGYDDKWIGCYFQVGGKSEKEYVMHWTYISEGAVSGKPTNNTGNTYILI